MFLRLKNSREEWKSWAREDISASSASHRLPLRRERFPRTSIIIRCRKKLRGEPFQLNDSFIGRDRYLWAEKEVTLPCAKEGCQVWVCLTSARPEEDITADLNPCCMWTDILTRVWIPIITKCSSREKEGEKVRLTFLLWTGLEGGGVHRTFYHQLKQADLGYLHKNTDELYYFARAITETLMLLPEDDENYASLKTALDRALLYIDWDEDTFYESVDKAHQVLMDELDRLEKHTDVTVHVVGHTHIDVAWLWRLKHTREKAQRSFSTVLRLMEQYDEYVFLQTQPQLYKYIKEDCPSFMRASGRELPRVSGSPTAVCG